MIDVDWDAVLTKTLLRAADDATPEDFLATLRAMSVELEDGHAGAWHTALEKHGRLPFALDTVDGRLFVVGTLDPDDKEARFYFGDEILAIDGLPAGHLLDAFRQSISGSPQKKTAHALRQLRRGHLRDTADVRVRRTDGTEVTFDGVAYVEKKTPELRPDPMCELRAGIHYVDLTRAPVGAVLEKIDDLAQASGIIFDVRGYPRRNSENVLRHLTTDTLHSALWEIPQRIYPDQERLVGFDTSHWTLPPKEPLLSARVVFLTDARAISYSESFLGIVSHYRLGEIVGQPTAGANGNNNLFQLPAGFWFGWTGMRVRQHDGSRLHGIGIQPTVHAARTLEGVRAGRDEILEKALEILERTPSDQPL